MSKGLLEPWTSLNWNWSEPQHVWTPLEPEPAPIRTEPNRIVPNRGFTGDFIAQRFEHYFFDQRIALVVLKRIPTPKSRKLKTKQTRNSSPSRAFQNPCNDTCASITSSKSWTSIAINSFKQNVTEALVLMFLFSFGLFPLISLTLYWILLIWETFWRHERCGSTGSIG